MDIVSPYPPKPKGNPRVDDRLVLGGDLRACAQFHKQDNGAAANLFPNGTTSSLS